MHQGLTPQLPSWFCWGWVPNFSGAPAIRYSPLPADPILTGIRLFKISKSGITILLLHEAWTPASLRDYMYLPKLSRASHNLSLHRVPGTLSTTAHPSTMNVFVHIQLLWLRWV